ncbi:hypothetical protein SUGI_1151500 [Cryptomeria japonica]|nr:hypothetical protein SUGI_1151500 [Cryptomeria japonica]
MTLLHDGHETRQLAREAVRRSLVLLPLEPLLLLSKNAAKIMVAGSYANNPGYQCGGWAIDWERSSGQTTIEFDP